MADQVFEVTGRNPLLDIALELEKIALLQQIYLGPGRRDIPKNKPLYNR